MVLIKPPLSSSLPVSGWDRLSSPLNGSASYTLVSLLALNGRDRSLSFAEFCLFFTSIRGVFTYS